MKLTDRMRYTICFLAGGSLMVVIYFLFIYPKKVNNQVTEDENETIDTAKKEDNLKK